MGSPRAPVSAPAPSGNTYSAPSQPPLTSYSSPASSDSSSVLVPQSQYGSGATNTFSASPDPVIVDNSVPFSASAPDSYDISSIGQSLPVLTPEVKQAPASALDSYGAAESPVLPAAAPLDTYGGATTARSLSVDYYDDYDPNDVPADQAAPELPSYGISSTPDSLDTYGVASNSALIDDNFLDDYDPLDVPADQVRTGKYSTSIKHKITASVLNPTKCHSFDTKTLSQ